jgi:hypothetical protein
MTRKPSRFGRNRRKSVRACWRLLRMSMAAKVMASSFVASVGAYCSAAAGRSHQLKCPAPMRLKPRPGMSDLQQTRATVIHPAWQAEPQRRWPKRLRPWRRWSTDGGRAARPSHRHGRQSMTRALHGAGLPHVRRCRGATRRGREFHGRLRRSVSLPVSTRSSSLLPHRLSRADVPARLPQAGG